MQLLGDTGIFILRLYQNAQFEIGGVGRSFCFCDSGHEISPSSTAIVTRQKVQYSASAGYNLKVVMTCPGSSLQSPALTMEHGLEVNLKWRVAHLISSIQTFLTPLQSNLKYWNKRRDTTKGMKEDLGTHGEVLPQHCLLLGKTPRVSPEFPKVLLRH